MFGEVAKLENLGLIDLPADHSPMCCLSADLAQILADRYPTGSRALSESGRGILKRALHE